MPNPNMKLKMIFTAAALAAVSFWFSGCNQKTETDDSALEAARKDAAAVSNQLTEVSMKLNHFEQMVKVLELEVTNLTQTVAQYSNKVLELRAHLADQQKQLIAAQTEVPKREVRIMDLETKLQEQTVQLARLTGLLSEGNSRVPELEKQLKSIQEQYEQSQAEIARLKLERAELLRLWDDPAALKARLNVVDPELIKKATSKMDKKSRLTLNTKGGVELSPASAAPPAKKPVKKTSGEATTPKS